MKNILFVCKHNVFRSKVAEAYFNKINKNRKITADGAGLIKPDILSEVEKKMISLQKRTAKECGIDIVYGSKSLSTKLLRKQNIIIIVADDVPEYVFNSKFYLKPDLKIIVWKIPDVKGEESDKELIKVDIKLIMEKVNKLVEELK